MSDQAQALAVFVGVITYVTGERGVIKHITHSRHGEPDGALQPDVESVDLPPRGDGVAGD